MAALIIYHLNVTVEAPYCPNITVIFPQMDYNLNDTTEASFSPKVTTAEAAYRQYVTVFFIYIGPIPNVDVGFCNWLSFQTLPQSLSVLYFVRVFQNIYCCCANPYSDIINR